MLLVFGVAMPYAAHAVPWFPFGPDGGDARAFASDPRDHLHLYLGTLNGWIYDSHDGGRNWLRLARLGKRDDLALDNIVVDEANPKHLIVGAWVLDHPDGGLYTSNDAGLTWSSPADMRGQSVRSLAQSRSEPRELIAGTLQGVFRSVDSGAHWRQISPLESKELHEVESIAIDPVDPNIIYAGTWHLPWKTTDGGEHWQNIKEGIIEDSDVFSIIVDPATPQTVYLSACSGIYKSENSGARFSKIQGIPSDARRTRVLMQDPRHLNIVFAGTTEGLFRSGDSGQTWLRTTDSETVVNDVYVDESNPDHVLLATDRSGVLLSNDGGYSFRSSNTGFSARQITAFAAERIHPANVFVGVVNDKAWGGVFASKDGGISWEQQSAGLQGSDIFSLTETGAGTLLAGTGHGVFRMDGGVWKPAEALSAPRQMPAAKRSARHAIVMPSGPKRNFDAAIFSLASADNREFAATSSGLLSSADDGVTWTPVRGTSADAWRFVAASGQKVVAATLLSMIRSGDGGRTWKPVELPAKLTQISAIAVEETGEIWAGGREGVFTSNDGGVSWQTPENLFVSGVNSIFYDQATRRVLLTALGATTMAFTVQLPAKTVTFVDTGWNLRFVRPVGDHMIAATLFDGIVVQPRMVVSPVNADAAAKH
jgi:photosystem II stability/assembly factor-like uncharacterized protein